MRNSECGIQETKFHQGDASPAAAAPSIPHSEFHIPNLVEPRIPIMRVVMMGAGTFAEPTLEALLNRTGLVVGLVTQPDRAAGAQRGSTRQVGRGMKEIARSAGVPVFQPERINTPEGTAQLSEWRPDLLVVAAYGQILS